MPVRLAKATRARKGHMTSLATQGHSVSPVCGKGVKEGPFTHSIILKLFVVEILNTQGERTA